MSSEAILENPALFADISQLSQSTPSITMLSLAEEYLQLVHKYPHGTSLKSVRQHLMKFLYKYFLYHEHLRNRAGDAKTLHDYEEGT